jgi:prepilin-type processing-associated H-X9-DG protein
MTDSLDSPSISPIPLVCAQPQRTNRISVAIALAGVFGIMALTVVALGAWLYPAVVEVRAAARRVDAANQIRQLLESLQNYHNVHGMLPPAQTQDDQGKPLQSWRSIVLPYLEAATVGEQIDRDSPWDSPVNRQFHDASDGQYFVCARGETSDSGMTHFVAVVDEGTVLRKNETIAFKDITDGVAITAILIELPESDIHWMEPRDVNIEQAIRIIQDNPYRGGVNVGFADGSVFAIPQTTSAEEIRAIFLASDELGHHGRSFSDK